MLRVRFDVKIPKVLKQTDEFVKLLEEEFTQAVEEVSEETLSTLKAKSVVFRRVTREGWRKLPVQKEGNRFVAILENQEITAAVLEYGATFSAPPPIKSRKAGAGRGLYDWVGEVDPVFVGEIKEKILKQRSGRRSKGRLRNLGKFPTDETNDTYRTTEFLQEEYAADEKAAGLLPIDELALRKAAHQIAASIHKRGLPSSSNRGTLLLNTRIMDAAQEKMLQRAAQAMLNAFRRSERIG